MTSRRNHIFKTFSSMNSSSFFWHVVNRYINWTSISSFFYSFKKVKQSHFLSCSFLFQRATITAIYKKKNFCLQSCWSAAPFALSRELSQPINLLLDIVRLFTVCWNKKIRRTKKQWQAACVCFFRDILHSSVPYIQILFLRITRSRSMKYFDRHWTIFSWL